MTRPIMSWKGDLESQQGVATFICGNMREDMQLQNFQSARLIERIIEKAWIDGVRDGQEDMERKVSVAIKECKSKW